MSLNAPEGYRFSQEHEWVSPGNDEVKVGITEIATEALGEIVYLQLPEVGDQVTAGETCGEVESTKSVSDLFSPVTGTVTEVNADAVDAPESVNQDPYQTWLFAVKVDEEGPLMDADEYEAFAAK